VNVISTTGILQHEVVCRVTTVGTEGEGAVAATVRVLPPGRLEEATRGGGHQLIVFPPAKVTHLPSHIKHDAHYL
jgi:hypothetical protein